MTSGESEKSGGFRAQAVIAESHRLETGIESSANFGRIEVPFRTYENQCIHARLIAAGKIDTWYSQVTVRHKPLRIRHHGDEGAERSHLVNHRKSGFERLFHGSDSYLLESFNLDFAALATVGKQRNYAVDTTSVIFSTSHSMRSMCFVGATATANC